MAAFGVALALRLGGGEPLVGVPPLLPYAHIAARLVHRDPASWYAPGGSLLFPFRTVAVFAGLVLLPVVSRVSARRDMPQPLYAVDRV